MNNTNSNETLSGNDFDFVGIFIGLSALGVLIFIANGLVFVLVYKERSLVRKTNYFLISLAVADILSGLIGIPLIILSNTLARAMDDIAKAMDISNKFLAFASILHILTATIERYIKVLAPFHYRRLVTRRRVLLVLAGIWLVSLTTPLIELTWGFEAKISQVYSMVLLLCFVIIPLLVMVFMTIHIFYLIRQQKKRLRTLSNRTAAHRQRKRKQAQRRATIVYFVMSFSFAVSWFPYFLTSLFSDLDHGSRPLWVETAFLFMKFSSALIDPLIYTFFKTDFQAALRHLVMPPSCSNDTEATIPMTLHSNHVPGPPAPSRSSSDDKA